MTVPVDPAPYGARAPDAFVRAILAFTRRLPANWFGFRMSTPYRRLAIDWLGERPVDTELWHARLRLYPARNSCEKNALFTPQIFDVRERAVLAAAIDACIAQGRRFTFVDIGANVGLYSLFVASRARGQARVLAAEPQPGIVERFRFNVGSNPGFDITVLPLAVTDREGQVDLVIQRRDRAGSYVDRGERRANDGEKLSVPCRPLLAILAEAGIAAIDALKIDIEGSEDLALAPFLREVPDSLLPRLVLIEERPDWALDLYALLEQRGYVRAERSRFNLVFRLP
jgi:FkbM family methyltransferase